MHPDDPRFTSFPKDTGPAQLRWYILQTAKGALSIQELLADFRNLHEAIERAGPPEYASAQEAKAIWDVLWAVEFCSPDIAKEENPEDWYIPEEVLTIVRRSAEKLER